MTDETFTPREIAELDQSAAVFSAWLDKMVAAFPAEVAAHGHSVALVSMGAALRELDPERLAIALSIAVMRLAERGRS